MNKDISNSIFKNPAAVLFDLDGVLINSSVMHNKCWNLAVKNLTGKEIKTENEYHGHGASSAEIAQLLLNKVKEKLTLETLLKEKNRLLHLHENLPPLLPGALNVIDFYSSYPSAIVTNGSREFAKHIIKSYNLNIKITIGYEDYINPKPDPDPYLRALQTLNISKKQKVLAFDDSIVGLTSALKAGCIPIGIDTRGRISNNDISVQNFSDLQAFYSETILYFV